MKMKKICILLAFILIFTPSPAAFGDMSSENYHIQNSVLSGGGLTTISENYQMSSTLGQPSPLADPTEPPISDSYDLYPGFWHVIAALGSSCPGDYNGDKDVDGSDLAGYIFDSGGLGLDVFAANFGKKNCP